MIHKSTKLISFCLALCLLLTVNPLSVAFAATTIADDQNASDKVVSENVVFGQTMVSTNYQMRTSEAGFEMIKDFEGYTPYAEWDYSQWTYGYGSRAEYEGQYISESDAAQLCSADSM